MYLSYSGYKKYRDCPRLYWYGYIAKPPARQDNQLGTLYGTAVGLVFEKFYAEHLWKDRNCRARLEAYVEAAVGNAYNRALRQGVIKWNTPTAQFQSRDALIQGVREAVVRGIKIITYHVLIGKVSAAEVKLDTLIKGHVIGGRADFIIVRIAPYNDLCILDGKGSRHRDQYAEATQLRWYGMQYRAKYGVLPDRFAFVFWQFEAPEAVDWVPVRPSEIDDLQERVLEAIAEIEVASKVMEKNAGVASVLAEQFPARCGDRCRFCVYSSLCPEGSAVSGQKKVLLPEVTGVHDIGLD